MEKLKWLPHAGLILLLGAIVYFTVAATNSENQKKARTMITDRLENAGKYTHLHPAFAQAFAFLQRPDLVKLEHGKHVIDGDKIFATIGVNQGRKKNEAKLEAHRKYIDIQYVIAGYDEMGWRDLDECRQIATAYKPDGDIEFFADPPTEWKKVSAGSFAIFFPEDAHAPLVSDGEVTKVVVKVAVK